MPVSPAPRETFPSENAPGQGNIFLSPAQIEEDLRVQIAYREHAEATVRRNESKYQALLENAHDLISVITPDGLMIYQSPSAESILGHAPENLIGLNCFDGLIHPDDQPATRGNFAKLRDGGATKLVWETRFRHADGNWRMLECIGSMAPADAPLFGIVLNSRDVTRREDARRELEERTRQQTALAELSRFALQGLDLYAIYITAAELVADALGVRFTTITEILPEPGKLVIRAGAGGSTNVIGSVVDGWRSIAPDGHSNSKPIVIDDLALSANNKMFACEHWQAQPLSAASVPIFCRGKPFGFLGALSVVSRKFTPREVTFLETMAHLLSAIIEGRQNENALRAVEARFRRIAANTPGIVYQYVLHPDGSASLPFISDACRTLFGVEPEVARQHPNAFFDAVCPEGRASMHAAMLESARTLKPLYWEGAMRTPAGEELWITARARPERQLNSDVIWDGVMFDLTQLKAAETALRAAKEEAENASRVKSDFLSRVSHELRTPLNAILGFGQLLELDTLTEAQTASVQQILAGGRNLLGLINEILDIARIERGDGEIRPAFIELRPAIDKVMAQVQPMASARGITLANEAPPGPECAVFADPGRFEQALLNLLTNAVKFNHPGGSVRCTAAPGPDQRTRVSVIDDGPGVAAEFQHKLFTPFERLDAADRGIEGTGLGLAIAKSVIEAMGGKIGFAPAPESGAVFFLDLPRAAKPGDNARP
jgi:PAS domain S-box-containing protein